MNDILELLNKREELHPELARYLSEHNGIPCIRHPLVYSMFHTPQQNALINAQYESKLKRLVEARKSKDFETFVFLHERPYRLEAFTEIHDNLKDPNYWSLLAHIYTDSENIWQYKSEWKLLLASKRTQSEAFMDESEQKHFANLPETLTIYRGYAPRKNAVGFSYTLDRERAVWFAHRFNRKGAVKKLVIEKSSALAYKSCRGEEEIVLRKPR